MRSWMMWTPGARHAGPLAWRWRCDALAEFEDTTGGGQCETRRGSTREELELYELLDMDTPKEEHVNVEIDYTLDSVLHV